MDMEEGARATFELPAGAAFGERNPDMQQWLARKVLTQMGDPLETYNVGDVVQFPTPDGQGQFAGVVLQLRGEGAERDAVGLRVSHGGESLRELRHLLLPILHAVNDRVGFISRGAINYISQRLDVAPAEIYGVATFYALFDTNERPARQVHVCVDLACGWCLCVIWKCCESNSHVVTSLLGVGVNFRSQVVVNLNCPGGSERLS